MDRKTCAEIGIKFLESAVLDDLQKEPKAAYQIAIALGIHKNDPKYDPGNRIVRAILRMLEQQERVERIGHKSDKWQMTDKERDERSS